MTDFMQLAKDLASHSRCVKRQVGAVVERDGVLMGVGNNDTMLYEGRCLQEEEGDYSQCDWCGQCGHAEVKAMLCAEENGGNLGGATLHLYGHDYACENCVDLMEHKGIERLVIG